MFQEIPEYRRQILICLILTVTVLAAFWQVSHNEFISFDDDLYITNNGLIQNGITIEVVGIVWTGNRGL